MTGQMEAGRELDALVAEKVMGAEWDEQWAVGYSILKFREDVRHLVTHDWACEKKQVNPACPHYSTDIAAAWLIVERLRPAEDTRYGVTIESDGAGWYCTVEDADVEWDDPAHTSVAYGETLPLAICRAALASVGAT
jgi:hypothetical protein